MKPSQNLETDLLLAHVGELTRSSNAPPWQTSEDAGLAALNNFLAAAGVPANDVQFDEGSGLSRNNLTTANATVALLQFMAKHRAAADFIAALPVAGVDGTLSQPHERHAGVSKCPRQDRHAALGQRAVRVSSPRRRASIWCSASC